MLTYLEFIAIDSIRKAAQRFHKGVWIEKFEDFIYEQYMKQDKEVCEAVKKAANKIYSPMWSAKCTELLVMCKEYENRAPTPTPLEKSEDWLETIVIYQPEPACHCSQGHNGMHTPDCLYMVWKYKEIS